MNFRPQIIIYEFLKKRFFFLATREQEEEEEGQSEPLGHALMSENWDIKGAGADVYVSPHSDLKISFLLRPFLFY